jgi:hypothetical protein
MKTVKYIRGDSVKFTFDAYADKLAAEGWALADKADAAPVAVPESFEEPKDNRRLALYAEAVALGLKPHHRAGEDKLEQMIKEAKGG